MPIKDAKQRAKEKLMKDRGMLVVKHNDFIQKSRHQLSLQEQKIVLYLISKVKPDDVNFTEQVFSIAEFCKICGFHGDSGKNYSDLKKSLQSIRDRSVWIEKDDGSITTLGWIDKVTINKNSGLVTLKLDEDLKPFLLQLEEDYTLYQLRFALVMTSQYSIRLYELLKSYAFKVYTVFELDELKRRLNAENYERNPDFKRKVLEIAVREINKHTDIRVEYSFEKEGRKFVRVAFSIQRMSNIDTWMAGFAADKVIGT